MNTVKDRVEYVLAKTKIPILYYSGHLDLIVPTVGTDNFLRSLNWDGKEAWAKANRTVWTDQQDNAIAYSTTVNQLTFAIMRNAGHMVPFDQPANTFMMIMKFIGDL